MSGTVTVKCGCGRWYRQYPMYVGDQSVCGRCRAQIEEEIREQDKKIISKSIWRLPND